MMNELLFYLVHFTLIFDLFETLWTFNYHWIETAQFLQKNESFVDLEWEMFTTMYQMVMYPCQRQPWDLKTQTGSEKLGAKLQLRRSRSIRGSEIVSLP